ncbi:hypothetical protein BJ912DRAFT_424738 [Pholiota molesta]|nr:hypothetical protein BJ912DRAFT_424738 [Pholiota molesta]
MTRTRTLVRDAVSQAHRLCRRPTMELSLSGQREEARVPRNRIAAQNPRDRRKAQFSHLQWRVAELEEENRRLRAGMHVHLIYKVCFKRLARPPSFARTGADPAASFSARRPPPR